MRIRQRSADVENLGVAEKGSIDVCCCNSASSRTNSARVRVIDGFSELVRDTNLGVLIMSYLERRARHFEDLVMSRTRARINDDDDDEEV